MIDLVKLLSLQKFHGGKLSKNQSGEYYVLFTFQSEILEKTHIVFKIFYIEYAFVSY
jgi:hypothetical protein